ncbi:MAG: cupin domain-containing protein [Sneathiella sp.]|nr:cupin domain-containing protein [Sneathiella sp.]
MHLHDDFKQRAVMHGEKLDWIASPMKGVDRRMLERIGGEVARATTIVRYAPGSAFSPHTHTGGEEFIVLEGVFQDEHGDYPVGSYVRNPPTSSHTPGSEEGCVILVKLWQYDPEDRSHVVIDLNKMEAIDDPHQSGVSITPLFKDNRETVRLEHWKAGEIIELGSKGGAEYFVLDGSFTFDAETFQRHSWLRLPEGDKVSVTTGEEGARVWVKTDHLPFAKAP